MLGSEVAIADIKVKLVLSISTLVLDFIGSVIGLRQVRTLSLWPISVSHPRALTYEIHFSLFQVGSFYNDQNNKFVSIDTAPKYVFQAGFSCTIAGLLLATFAFLIDLAASLKRKDGVTGKPTFRASPNHVEYHVTNSPFAYGSPGVLAIQNVAAPGL
jgi:hypothetical protein